MNSLEKSGLDLAKLLKAQGFAAFFVGGFVRDKLLKRASDNLDIATDAKPNEVIEILKSNKIPTKEVGKKFGTVLAILNKFPIEITTFRAETGYSDKRHPDKVIFIKDYKEDASRRDFTINAMFFDPTTKELYDPVGGLRDLKLKLIEFVGDPRKRIDEDHLRMMRAVRLYAQLGFRLEKKTYAAIKIRAKLIQKISAERIKSELDKILLSQNRDAGLRLLSEIGLLKFILPEVQDLRNLDHGSNRYHLEGDMFEHTLLALEELRSKDLDLLYAVLLHDVGKPGAAKKIFRRGEWVISTHGHAKDSTEIFQKISKNLKFPSKSSKKISWLIANHMLKKPFETEMRPVKKMLLALHPYFGDLLELWRADYMGNLQPGSEVKPPKAYFDGKKILKLIEAKRSLLNQVVSGNLVMEAAKIKPGPKVGELKKVLATKILLGEIDSLAEAKRFLKRLRS